MTETNGVVIDANVIIHGSGDLPYSRILTTEGVFEEIKSELSQFKLQALDLEVFEPEESLLKKVRDEASRRGIKVSEEDCSIVALSIEKDFLLISDDKGVQNLCLHLGVDFDSYLGDRVSEKMVFDSFCKNCGESRDESNSVCRFCGSSEVEQKRVS